MKSNEALPQTDEMYGGWRRGIEWGGSGWARKPTSRFPSCGRTRLAVGSEGPGSTGAEMSVSRSVAEILSEHVTLEIESIDRMYLNVYVPALQRAGGVASFFRFHRGHQFASSA